MKQNDDSINAVLTRSLLELKRAMDPSGIPIIIGGGMGLYLRETYLPEERSPRYQFRLPIRSTNDLDIFLTAEMVVDVAGFASLKAVLSKLEYTALQKAEYFQFEKQVVVYGEKRNVRVDLLAAPPREADEAKVKVSGIRVRPKGVSKIPRLPDRGGQRHRYREDYVAPAQIRQCCLCGGTPSLHTISLQLPNPEDRGFLRSEGRE